MIDHYVAAGVDGCTILGIMGAAPKLDHDEAIGFVAQCVKRAPKLPFVVGVPRPASRRCGRCRTASWQRARLA
jgi:4-hydroxy-tetrahydrodipicolinate synthase